MSQNSYNILLPDYKKSIRKKVSDDKIIDRLYQPYQKIQIDDNMYPKTSVRLVDIKHAFDN
jgi:hypothetical protein